MIDHRRAMLAAALLLATVRVAAGQPLPTPAAPYREMPLATWQQDSDSQASVITGLEPILPVPGPAFKGYTTRHRIFRYMGKLRMTIPDWTDDAEKDTMPGRSLHVYHFQFPTAEAARLACSWFVWAEATASYLDLARPFEPALALPWRLEELKVGGHSIFYDGKTRPHGYLHKFQFYFWPTRNNGLILVYHYYHLLRPDRYLAALVAAHPPAGKDALFRDPAQWAHRAGPALIDSLAASRDPRIRSALHKQLRGLVLQASGIPEDLAWDNPAESVRRWRAWWERHGRQKRIEWLRLAVDRLLAAGSNQQAELQARAGALHRAQRLISTVLWVDIEPPGTSNKELVGIQQVQFASASPEFKRRAREQVEQAARRLGTWWAGCRGGKPLDWYHAFLRVYLDRRTARSWVELDLGLRRLEQATAGGCPPELLRTRWLEPEPARQRYAAWQTWLDGPGRRFQPRRVFAVEGESVETPEQIPWVAPLLRRPPSIQMTLIPTIVDRRTDPLLAWYVPLREASFTFQVTPTTGATLRLMEFPRKPQYPLWLRHGHWLEAGRQAEGPVFSVPEYVRWHKSGETLLLRAGGHGSDTIHATWLARSGPERWWIVRLIGDLDACRKIAAWLEPSFPSLLQPSPAPGDFDRFVREYVDWQMELLDDPRWGMEPTEQLRNLLAFVQPGAEVIGRLLPTSEGHFANRAIIHEFWKAHRGETAAERYRRFVDSMFVRVRQREWKESELLVILNQVQGVLLATANVRDHRELFPWLPGSGLEELRQAADQWYCFWQANRLKSRPEQARSLVDAAIAWTASWSSKGRTRPRIVMLFELLEHHLPDRLHRSKERDEELERQLLAWWKANRDRCFVKLPPWYLLRK